jgi:hypothetical protein
MAVTTGLDSPFGLRETEAPRIFYKIYPTTGPDRSRGLQEVKTSRISRQTAHEGGNVVNPTHRPPLPPREDPWYSLLLESESSVEICTLREKFLTYGKVLEERKLPRQGISV